MKCKKCSKKNPENSKFCAHCGSTVGSESSFEHIELYDAVIEHLEFLGFEVGQFEEIDGGKHRRVFATNSKRSNLTITFNKSGVMTFCSYYSLDKEKVNGNKIGALDAINKMNLSSVFCSYCLQVDGSNLICSSWYPKDYKKISFSDFLESYESDIKEVINSSGILDFS